MDFQFSATERQPAAVVKDVISLIGNKRVLIELKTKNKILHSIKAVFSLAALDKLFAAASANHELYYITVYGETEDYVFPWTWKKRSKTIAGHRIDGIRVKIT